MNSSHNGQYNKDQMMDIIENWIKNPKIVLAHNDQSIKLNKKML